MAEVYQAYKHKEYNPEWKTIDPWNITKNYMDSGQLLCSEVGLSLLVKLRENVRHETDLLKMINERQLIEALEERGAFSCIDSSYPFPVHTDPKCRSTGLYSPTDKNTNVSIGTLATAEVSLQNSETVLNDVVVVGAAPDLEENSIWVGTGEDGITLKSTNSKDFESTGIVLITIPVVITIVFIIIAVLIGQLHPNQTIFQKLHIPSHNVR